MTDTTVVDDQQTSTSAQPEQKPAKVEFTDEQNDWISRKVAYELKVAQEKRDAADAEVKKKADADAERKRQEEAGEFDKVKLGLETDLQNTTTERDALKTRVETLEALAEDRLKALIADLPQDIADLGPADDTPIETRLAWAERAVKAAGKSATATPGNGPNPKPASGQRDIEAAKQEARRKYSI